MKIERKLEPYEQQFLMLFCEGIRLAHQKRQFDKEAKTNSKTG
ncbi:hypothetical protein GCM10008022_20370 [Paenibacillus hunanensis]|uniref:Uncharacterized protein n=1 Tax=Paenibacillus hunanensis TaxID=539262 RepID=A0ABU1IV91_9BACL|nr:hypothetical protein [Paenibacillus hunanensis]GGJ11136.1 hypothetical protein GCM10008022_20370 [Paenibacillus hunanensis]